MQDEMGVVESRFADIVWEHAPLTTGELVRLCAAELNWKRTTTYTVLKKLCGRGLFRLQDGTVTVLLTREDYRAGQSERFVSETFGGSLPAFVAAFARRKKLSPGEIEEIRRLIDSYGEGD